MTPIIELRGAIPFGVSQGLSLPLLVFISIVGNMIPIPFIILFIRKVFVWLKQKNNRMSKFIIRLENRAHHQSKFVIDYKLIGLCILVAIPFPGTGAWTGALVAALLELRLKDAIPSIFAGVCISAFIVSCFTKGIMIY